MALYGGVSRHAVNQTVQGVKTFSGTLDISGTFQLGGVTVAATAAELDNLAGYTGTTAELNVLDLTAALGTSTASEAMVRSSANEMDGVPLGETQSVDPSQKVTLYDDFLEGTLDASRWEDADGTDAQAIGPLITLGSINGEVVLTSGNVGDGGTPGNTTAVVDGASIDGKGLMWQADQGGLQMEVRVKLTTVAESILFVGFQDEVSVDADVNLAMQATGTGNVIKTEVTDSCGMIYDTSFATDPTLFQMGGNKTAVTTTVVGATGPADATYVTIRITVSVTGTLEVFINGTSIGTIANAVTITVPLTPTVTVATNNTTESVATVDYIWVQQDR